VNSNKIFDDKKVDSALNAIYEHNFVKDMHNHFNPCRIYCLNDEQGLIICAYPDTVYRPFISVPYAEETMHGFEYQAATHMIKRGMEEKGVECVAAVRNRYDGERRNPWNEFECGSNYARSMASYALLLTYSGFEYDMHHKLIGFKPIHQENSKFFWSLQSAWGTVEFTQGCMTLSVLYGSLDIKQISLAFTAVQNVTLDDVSLEFTYADGKILFNDVVTIGKGHFVNCVGKMLKGDCNFAV